MDIDESGRAAENGRAGTGLTCGFDLRGIGFRRIDSLRLRVPPSGDR